MDDLSRFCCQNTECQDYGKRGGENLSVCARYGPNKQKRMLRCRTCKARFSERKGTPLFGANLPEEKVPRHAGTHRGRMRRSQNRPFAGCASRHGDALQSVGRRPRPPTPRRTRGRFPPIHARFSSTKSGRSWAKRKNAVIRPTPTTLGRETTGTMWPSIPNIAWWSAWCRASGTVEKVEALVADFKQRTGGRTMNLITSDEYKPYRRAILKAYGKKTTPERTGKPGRPKAPHHEPSPRLRYATVHKTRRKGRVVKIDFRVVFGTVAGVMRGVEVVEGQQQNQHGVCGTTERDRPQPEWPQGS